MILSGIAENHSLDFYFVSLPFWTLWFLTSLHCSFCKCSVFISYDFSNLQLKMLTKYNITALFIDKPWAWPTRSSKCIIDNYVAVFGSEVVADVRRLTVDMIANNRSIVRLQCLHSSNAFRCQLWRPSTLIYLVALAIPRGIMEEGKLLAEASKVHFNLMRFHSKKQECFAC